MKRTKSTNKHRSMPLIPVGKQSNLVMEKFVVYIFKLQSIPDFAHPSQLRGHLHPSSRLTTKLAIPTQMRSKPLAWPGFAVAASKWTVGPENRGGISLSQ